MLMSKPQLKTSKEHPSIPRRRSLALARKQHLQLVIDSTRPLLSQMKGEERNTVEEKLKNVMQEHGALVDELEVSIGCRDPVLRLPVEIFARFVRGFAEDESFVHDDEVPPGTGNPSFINMDYLFYLTTVSATWRATIFDIPSLWSDISFNDHNWAENGALRTHLCLALSKSAPLSIRVGADYFTEEASFIISTIVDRIDAIYLDDSPELILGALQQFSPFPNLVLVESMARRDAVWDDFAAVAGGSPKLKYLVGIQSHKQSIPDGLDGMLSKESSFYAGKPGEEAESEDVNPVRSAIFNSNPVRSVHFQVNDRPEQKDSWTKLLGAFGDETLSWTSFCCSGRLFRAVAVAPLVNLSKLSLELLIEDLVVLLDVIPALNKLHELSIRVEEAPSRDGKPFSLPTGQFTATSVRRLRFTLTSSMKRPTAYGAEMAAVFAQAFSRLEDLDLFTPFDCDVIEWLGSPLFPYLRFVKFPWLPSPEDDIPVFGRAVDLYRVTVMTDGASFPSWPNSRIKSLITQLDEYDPADIAGKLSRRAWRHLEHLSTDHPQSIPLTSLSLPHLHSLVLTRAGDSSTTRFCRDLALHPTALPSLRHIVFWHCPEIDILFLMLEARNIWTDEKVSRIESIGTPVRVPSSYYKALRDVLQGKLSPRPTEHQLSLVGKMETLLDSSCLGCLDCHRALIICTEPLEKAVAQPMDIPYIPYPMSSVDILTSWEARYALWENLGHHRRESCGIYSPSVISKDSLRERWTTDEEDEDRQAIDISMESNGEHRDIAAAN